MSSFLEITDLDQRGPEFEAGPYDTNRIIHDTKQVVLKEVRFKTIEGLLKISCKQPEGVYPLLVG